MSLKFNGTDGITFNDGTLQSTAAGELLRGTSSVDTVIGMVAPFAMDSVPTGWLHCDGTEVSRDTYSLLYSKVGDLYGAGDGSTTFNLPDLQDEFIRGSSDTLPVGTKQNDATAVNGLQDTGHTHTLRAKGVASNSSVNCAIGSGGDADIEPATSKDSAVLVGDVETRPRNVAMLYCINATAEPSSGGGSIWTEVDDPAHIAPEAVYAGNIVVDSINIGTAANGKTSNVMVGRNASGQNKVSSGFNNVAIGDNAFAKMGSANDCVAVGFQALKANESGDLNTALGAQSLLTNIIGSQNTAVGDGALENSTEDNNTAIGVKAGNTLATGKNNTLIGSNAQPSAVDVSNEVTIGDSSVTTVRMGNGDVIYPSSGGGDGYTKAEIDAKIAANDEEQNAQDVKIVINNDDIARQQIEIDNQQTSIDKNTNDITTESDRITANTAAIAALPTPVDTYSKSEIDAQQSAQDDVTATKLTDAPDDGLTYARNDKTWVSISETSGIPDAPVDGFMYGRKDGNWNPVADAGDIYTKTEIDAQQSAQDAEINTNHTDIVSLETKTDTNLAYIGDNATAIANNTTNITANTAAIAALSTPVDAYTKTESDAIDNAQDVEIAKKANTSDTYTKEATDTLLDNKANVGDSYLKAETYTTVEVDGKLFEKANTETTYTKAQIDAQQSAQDVKIDKNYDDIILVETKTDNNLAYIADNVEAIAANTAAIATKIPEAPIDGKQYGRQDAEWTEVVGGEGGIPEAPIDGKEYARKDANWTEVTSWTDEGGVAVVDTNILVNNVTVGAVGSNNTVVGRLALTTATSPASGNTAIGFQAMNNSQSATGSTAVGNQAMANSTGTYNTGIGTYALKKTTGTNNTGIGYKAGDTLEGGFNNLLLGYNAQPSSPTVSNEVTIGDDAIISTRLKGNVYAPKKFVLGSEVTNTRNADLYVKGYGNSVVIDEGYGGDGIYSALSIRRVKSTGDFIDFWGEGGVTGDGQKVGSISYNSAGLYFDGLTTTISQVEGLDKKLAIKDKLIEKLSARLDKLEKRMK